MKAVADTGIIIGLAKANRLSLLKNLFEKVLIPPKVHRELLARTVSEEALIGDALQDFRVAVQRDTVINIHIVCDY